MRADARQHGLPETGLTLARRFERVFADAELVVSPSSSCVAYLRENGAGLDGRLFELSEFLVDRLGVDDVGARSRTGSRYTRPATRCG